MNDTADGTIYGRNLQVIGGLLLALTLAVSVLAFVDGDFVTGGAVLLYVPVAALLFAIGRSADLV